MIRHVAIIPCPSLVIIEARATIVGVRRRGAVDKCQSHAGWVGVIADKQCESANTAEIGVASNDAVEICAVTIIDVVFTAVLSRAVVDSAITSYYDNIFATL